MFPKKGNKFPGGHGPIRPKSPFAQLVSAALRGSLDNSHRAVKTVMIWTGAKERTVKHWLSGTHGPHGDYLLVLLGKSDAVVDALVGTLPPDRLTELAIRLIRRGGGDHQLPWSTVPYTGAILNPASPGPTRVDSIGSVNGDPNDPNPDPKHAPNSLDEYTDLNHRQIWFLRQLSTGRPMRARDLGRYHNVSEKTAKRDIAGLRRRKMIKYVGSLRKGHYLRIRKDQASRPFQ